MNTGEDYIPINLSQDEKITIRTFTEESISYDIGLIYKGMLSKFSWNLQEIAEFSAEEEIFNFKTSVNKGNRYIIFSTATRVVFLNEDFKEVKNINTIYPVKNLQMIHNFLSTLQNGEIIVSPLDNTETVALKCDFSAYTCGVNNYVFDSFLQVVYVLLNDGRLVVVSPQITYLNGNKYESNCEILKAFNTGLKIQNSKTPCSMEIIRKDLLIFNQNEVFCFDLEKIESADDFTEDKFAQKIVSLSKSDSHPKIQKISIGKYPYGHCFLSNTQYNTISQYDLIYPTAKLKGKEEFNWNFKVPLIFIALIILFFYHYFKNKKSAEVENMGKSKEDILEELKKYGVLDKNMQEPDLEGDDENTDDYLANKSELEGESDSQLDDDEIREMLSKKKNN